MIIRYINTASSGGDGTTDATSGANAAYASFKAFVDGELGVSGSPVTLSDDITVYATGTADTAGSTTIQYCTFGTYKVICIGDQGGGTKLDTSKYHLYEAGNDCLQIAQSNVNIEFWNWGFKAGTGSGDANIDISSSSTGVSIDIYNSVFTCETGYATDAGKILDNNNTGANPIFIYNSVFHDLGTSCQDCCTFFNCIFDGCVRGVRGPDIVVNSIFQNCTADSFGGSGTGSKNNLSDGTAIGADGVDSTTLTFTGGTPFDYRLASTDVGAMGAGVGVVAHPENYRYDVDGNDRHEYKPTCNIGPDNTIDSPTYIDVDTDGGGDYSSLSAAITALASSWVGDGDGSSEVRVRCQGTADDTTQATISGITTGGDRFIIEGHPGVSDGAHSGIFDSSKYRLYGSTIGMLVINQANVQIQKIQVINTANGDLQEAIMVDADVDDWDDVICLRGLLIEDTATTARGCALEIDDPAEILLIENCCLKMNSSSTSSYVIWQDNNGTGGTIYVVNCTLILNVGYGIRYDSASYPLIGINVSVTGTTTTGFRSGTALATGSEYNASDNNDADGSNPVNITTAGYVNAGGGDYHITTSSDMYQAGVGPAANNLVPWDDVDGNSRSGSTTDIGFDLYVSTGVTGSGAINNTVPTLSGTGKLGHTGSGAINNTVPTLSGTGKLGHTGSGAIDNTVPTLSSTGKLGHVGTGAISNPVPTLSGEGKLGHVGTGAIDNTVPILQGEGKLGHTGSGAIDSTVPTLSGTGKLGHTGSGAIDNTVPTLSGTGKLGHTGSGAIDNTVPTLSGTGSIQGNITGSGAINSTVPTLSGTGKLGHTGSGAIDNTVPTLSGTGSIQGNITGSGAIANTVPTLSGTGKLGHTGSGAIVSTVPTLSGTGSIQGNITGSGAIVSTVPTLSGTGKLGHTGSGAIVSTVPILQGEGKLGNIGSGAIVSTVPILQGEGKLGHVGTGAIANTVPTLSGTGKLGHTGSGAIDNTVPILQGEGTLNINTIIGSGTINNPVPIISGLGFVIPLPFRIRTIIPTSGSTDGGTEVVARVASNGNDVTEVYVNDVLASIVSQNSTYVTFTTPAGSAGTVDIKFVTSVGRSDTFEDAFTYFSGEANSAIGDYLRALETKLALSSWVTDSSNIIIGESVDLLGLDDDSFPRLEVLITKDKGDGYQAQRDMDFSFRYSIAGYIRRDSDAVTFADMETLMNFGIQTRALNYKFLDDKQLGNPPCSGFLQMGEFPECYYEFELFPKISAFICEVEAKLYLKDTHIS